MKSCIYGFKNKVNNKWYVGQTINLEQRKRDYYNRKKIIADCGSSDVVKNLDDFEFHVLEYCNEEELDKKEKEWIKRKNSFFNGYNRTKGGNKSYLCMKIPYEEKEIIDIYLSNPHKSLRDLEKELNLGHGVIGHILKRNKIKIRKGKSVIIVTNNKNNQKNTFSTCKEVVEFLFEQNEKIKNNYKFDTLRKKIKPSTILEIENYKIERK